MNRCTISIFRPDPCLGPHDLRLQPVRPVKLDGSGRDGLRVMTSKGSPQFYKLVPTVNAFDHVLVHDSIF